MDAREIHDALLELASASQPVVAARVSPSNRQRLRLADAVVRVLRLGRLGGLEAAPRPGREQAFETFKTALELALSAGVPRTEMVLVFNRDDDQSPTRKDLQ